MSGRHFISRNYKHPYCGGVIARTDIELTLERLGFTNIGLRRTFCRNNIVNAAGCFLSALTGMARIKSGDILLLQYPMSRYYRMVCRVAKWRKAKIITLIHDLRAFRNKSITAQTENRHLSDSDVLLTHNGKMRQWLSDHGCRVPMVDYTIMDYLHGESGAAPVPIDGKYSMYYVGNLSYRTNGFLYELAALMPDTDFYFYGLNPDTERIGRLPNVSYMGFRADSEIIASHKGDFGISWYGTSLDSGVGDVGEYMEYNNPHKVSLYLRCNTPVIVWDKAGRADFIEAENIGIKVGSLRDIKSAFERISPDDYRKMTENVERVNRKLKNGAYLEEALQKALRLID